jgi:hypothetical protein
MSLRDYKSKQIGPSQRSATRASNLIKRFKDKISQCTERYRVAHSALLALDPMGEWRIHLQQLKDEHIRAPGRIDDESEGFREVPWIWRVTRQYVPERVSSGDSSLEQLAPLSDKELDNCEHMTYIFPFC